MEGIALYIQNILIIISKFVYYNKKIWQISQIIQQRMWQPKECDNIYNIFGYIQQIS